MMGKILRSFVLVAFVISLFGLMHGCPQPTTSCKCHRKSIKDHFRTAIILNVSDEAQLRAECFCDDEDSAIPEAFWNYAALEVRYEQRVVLSNGTFVNSTFPELLYFALSGIQFIEPGAFLSGLETVQNLYLKRNFMNILERNTFAHLDGLLTLDAGDGNLYAVNNGTFLGLSKLQTLSLKNNSIWRISGDSFLGLRELTKLDLSHNNILHLYAKTFVHMPNLREVMLQNNNIGRVERNVFVNLPNLVTVNLEYNRINVLPEPQNVSSIEPNWHRTTVLLHDNPLRCDCHMEWASSWANQEEKHVSGRCYFPPEYQDSTLTNYYGNPYHLNSCHANGSDITAMEGSDFELSCPIEDAIWKTPKGMELQEHGERRDNLFLTNSDSLVIWNTRAQQEGTYVCRSEDGNERMEYRLVVQSQQDKTNHLTLNQWIAVGFSGLVVVVLVSTLAVSVVRGCHGNVRGQGRGYKGLPDHIVEDRDQPQPQPVVGELRLDTAGQVEESLRTDTGVSQSQDGPGTLLSRDPGPLNSQDDPGSHNMQPVPSDQRASVVSSVAEFESAPGDPASVSEAKLSTGNISTLKNICIVKDLTEKNVVDLRSPDISSNDTPSLQKYNLRDNVDTKSSVTSNNIIK